MAGQTAKQIRRRGSSRPPDLGWPPAPRFGVERLIGIAVVGVLLLVVLVALVAGPGSAPTGAPTPVVSLAAPNGVGSAGGKPPAPTTPSSSATGATTAATSAAAVQWYADGATVRNLLSDSEGLVRRHVAARDGVSLQPECARLTTIVGDARALPAAPDPTTAQLWSEALNHFATASATCGQLFDGTQIEVDVLLRRTTAALDEADTSLAALDESFSGR